MVKKISTLMLLSAFLFSCSTSNNVVNSGIFQKRKHNKGWYLRSESKLKALNDISKDVKKSGSKEISNPSTEEKTIKTANAIAISAESVKEFVLAGQGEISNSGPSTVKTVVKDEHVVKTSIIKDVEFQKQINKKYSKELKKDSRKNNSKRNNDLSIVILVILALLIPPLAVFLVRGIGTEFWISLILTLLFFLPGVIYALLVVLDII